MKIIPLALLSVLFGSLVSRAQPADASSESSVVSIESSGCTYIYHPHTAELLVRIGNRTIPLLRGLGPAWMVDSKTGYAAKESARLVNFQQQRGTNTFFYAAPGGIRWCVTLRRGKDGDVVIDLNSDQASFPKVLPGSVIAGGEWTGLDLNQYQMAHGQTNWPKTYYLRKYALFLCAWWDWQVSNASATEWLPKECEPRSGNGSFVPAATMLYKPSLEGNRAPLHESFHIRVASRLWDAALPSLCEPSEYRDQLAEMVYLDMWGGETVAEMKHILSSLQKLAGAHVRFLTIVQNWQAAGFDALLPDSIWMPDYPPNPALGSVEDYRELTEIGRMMGRFGFRTNYALYRDQAPSVLRGIVGQALDADGKPKWHTQPAKWTTLAERQEKEIAELWHPTASFTDQLASGGGPAIYTDFSHEGDNRLSTTLQYQRALARLIKSTHNGPLGSETLNQQDLIGRYCDFGDYGCMNGHNRFFTPDYKLRRLHTLTAFYGCGLAYRFFEPPPFKLFHSQSLPLWDDPSLMDDYRCCEVMLGNGAYVFWKSPWVWALTESILIGRLQRYYVLVPVESIDYLTGDKWHSLEEMVQEGFTPQGRPWLQKQKQLGRVRVRYRNGLSVYVNRLPEELAVDTPRGRLVLPQYGWVAFLPDGSLMACSAYRPGTQNRIELLEESSTKLRFLNPRGAEIEGTKDVRLWQEGKLLWSLNPEHDVADLGGKKIALSSVPVPLKEVDIDFRKGMSGCRATHGILRVEPVADGQRLVILSQDPYLFLPPLEITGRADDVVEVRLSTDAGTMGQLYFSTSEGALRMLSFKVQPDSKFHTISIPVGRHPRWPGARITRLRLDPVDGPSKSTVVLQSLRLKRK